VLLAAEGLTGPQIAERVGCTEPTVIKWRRQYAEAGLAGLEDAPRPGGPRRVLTGQAISEILSATVTPPPDALQAAGVTHWSSRWLAEWLRRSRRIEVSHDSITTVWRTLDEIARGGDRALGKLTAAVNTARRRDDQVAPRRPRSGPW
jgi:transposase